MPAAQRFLSGSFIQESMKEDILRAPRPKISKHARQKGNAKLQKLHHPKLCVLSKPESNVLNGKNRYRFPDPSNDKCVLLGIFDKDETLMKLHYIDTAGINVDESLEKEILHNPYEMHYFLKLEQIQIESPNGTTDIETSLHNKSIICAKLSDHTVSDTSVPKEVAGFWVRMFGPRSVFTMNFTLWSAEVNRRYRSNLLFKSKGVKSDFCNLEKLDEIHVQFENKPREESKQKNKRKTTLSNKQNVFEIKEVVKLVKKVRYCRDNGKLEEFDAQCSEFQRQAKMTSNIDEELALQLEQSVCLSYQGNPAEGKRLLQKAVQLSTKSVNSLAIKNRAYLFLALIHIHDGSFGTAQECLGMVQKEIDQMLSTEDLAFSLTLHGIVMMNFGLKLSEMSQFLWQEASENFQSALDICINHKTDMITDDYICAVHLLMAKLYLAMLKSACSPGCKMPDLENKISEHLHYFDDIEPVKLSRRTTICGLLLQGEYNMFLKKFDEATAIFENVKELIAIDNRLYHLETKILDKAQKCDFLRSKDIDDVRMAMLAKTRDLLTKSDSDTGYSGDESSSNEKVDLEAARYKQTTYV
ncbi:uncharacterized protein LOC135686835 [Rhopilema esculentum]|uniref:uncharacterized protein LOC135686835 n=1 Tax=Rhopilema esculentum TaxID=499914 RepID=UPI0031D42244|eukprot:gene250-9895_t